MTIQNDKAASMTGFPVDSPGYVTYQGTVGPNGMLLLRGYGIAGGVAGGLPRGSRYPFIRLPRAAAASRSSPAWARRMI
jgi:hypothetical protein